MLKWITNDWKSFISMNFNSISFALLIIWCLDYVQKNWTFLYLCLSFIRFCAHPTRTGRQASCRWRLHGHLPPCPGNVAMSVRLTFQWICVAMHTHLSAAILLHPPVLRTVYGVLFFNWLSMKIYWTKGVNWHKTISNSDTFLTFHVKFDIFGCCYFGSNLGVQR